MMWNASRVPAQRRFLKFEELKRRRKLSAEQSIELLSETLS
jgi:hypothetical protein